MVHSLYWVSALVYAMLLVIILINEKRTKKEQTEVGNTFRKMLCWVIYFCLQDILWGLCGSRIINNDNMFFISSTIFHSSTVITTFFWLKYMFVYLGDRIKHRRIYLDIDIVVIIFQFVLLIVNFFIPTIFKIVDGEYVTEFLRPVAFFNQYVVYLFMGIATLICAIKESGENRDRFLSVFIFALAPILSGVFQLLYPNGPFYSMGYFLGCFIVHMFVVTKDREKATKAMILSSIADVYYSLHLLNLREDSVEKIITSDLINKYVDKKYGIQKMLNNVMEATVSEQYKDIIFEFTNLDTISEKMKDSNIISIEFIGKHFGWTRMSFISVEKDENGKQKKIMIGIQIIDEEKKREQELINRSNTDELTGFLNRRAYEENMALSGGFPDSKDYFYISIDVNGLKVVNDNMGHDAGDDLLRGAAACMKKVFWRYGRLYRMGGDEFVVTLSVDDEKMLELKNEFEYTVREWRGDLVDSLSVSLGYASNHEFPGYKVVQIAKMADERMYDAKSEYYRERGVDRKGQASAHTALCRLYTKILKINITKDSYYIVNMDERESSEEMGFSNKISEWLYGFGTTGQVHKDDLQEYYSKTDINYLREYFKNDNQHLSIFYRRKYENDYNTVMLEIIKADDYSDENQSLFLYVKNIDK